MKMRSSKCCIKQTYLFKNIFDFPQGRINLRALFFYTWMRNKSFNFGYSVRRCAPLHFSMWMKSGPHTICFGNVNHPNWPWRPRQIPTRRFSFPHQLSFKWVTLHFHCVRNASLLLTSTLTIIALLMPRLGFRIGYSWIPNRSANTWTGSI